MIINKTNGILVDKSNKNGTFYYKIKKENNKEITISFKNDICPDANIGDEVFVEYLGGFGKINKGINLKKDFDLIFASRNMLFKNFIEFATAYGISCIPLLLCANIFNFIFTYIPQKEINHIFIGAVLLSFLLSCVFALQGINKISFFYLLKKKRDNEYREYKEKNFNRKDRKNNKTLNNEEKQKLISFMSEKNDLSATDKIDILNHIDSNNIKVHDIDWLIVSNKRKKLNRNEEIRKIIG